MDPKEIERRAVEKSVRLRTIEAFSVAKPVIPGLVIGLGAIPTERIPEGMRRLEGCLEKEENKGATAR